MIDLELTENGSRPAIVHSHGRIEYKPHWRPIRDAFFAAPASTQSVPQDLAIVTCNNGHPAMGCFERSLRHLGVGCRVLGGGIDPWINSRDKPRLIAAAARAAAEEYLLYADSRDAILIRPPGEILDRFKRGFDCDLLFGADALSYPADPGFRRYEDAMAAPAATFRYLNAGAWIGRTRFVAEFFEAACAADPLPSAPDSEQGIVRKLLPRYEGRVAIDYERRLFLNIGFIFSRRKFYQIKSVDA